MLNIKQSLLHCATDRYPSQIFLRSFGLPLFMLKLLIRFLATHDGSLSLGVQ